MSELCVCLYVCMNDKCTQTFTVLHISCVLVIQQYRNMIQNIRDECKHQSSSSTVCGGLSDRVGGCWREGRGYSEKGGNMPRSAKSSML